jgi:hypothetical protein
MKNMKILKSKFGEPDAIPLIDSDEVKSKVSPYVRLDLKATCQLIKQTSNCCLIIWVACLNKSRIVRGRNFRLNSRIREQWGIPDKRLKQKLMHLQETGWLKFKSEKGKAPLIIEVRESCKN